MDMRSMKGVAAKSLAVASYDPKKLAAIHTGAALLVSLVLTVLNYLLTRRIDTTAGLSQLGTRAVLSTAQSLLTIAGSLALPFWEIGFLYAALGMARQTHTGPKSLAEGFRRMGPVLRLFLLQGIMYLIVAIACVQVAAIVFSFTPFMENMLQAMRPILEQAATEQFVMDEATMKALLPAITPLYVILGILFIAVSIPLFYRFRMSQFAIMDDAPGALAAMKASGRMMRGNRFSLFKLDLSFWWFYALRILITVIAYGDVILPALGVTLPVSADTLFFVCYGIHLLLQLALAWKYASYVYTTYAHCYDTLRNAESPAPKPQPVPRNLPWDQ